MTNPVFEGLAEGLKSADAISSRDLALIGIDAKLNRLAEAAERQAFALEAMAALFASCIGRASAWCPGEPDSTPAVNYLRAGDGKNFKCDVAEGEGDE